ncbi:MAG: hypothetical protein JRJ84_12130, partial [Deltaproteobacteria bacterium]|nr:hypothetical protein [Deltaproteobacteria bacterium]
MYLVLLSLLVVPVFGGSVRALEVGDGPLLFLVRALGSSPHVVVVEAGSGQPARILLRGARMAPEARLDRSRVLVTLEDGLAMLDLAHAQVQPLMPGGGAELLSIDRTRGEILFYTHLDSADHIIGVALEPHGDDYRAIEWDESRATLHVAAMDLKEPARPLFDRPVRRVVSGSGATLLVVEASPNNTLWSVPRDGTAPKAIADLDPDWIPALLTSARSPNGRFLALGATHRDRYHHSRDLVVLDLETGERVLERAEVPASVSPISSFAPRLHLAWVDDRTLRHCETRGDVEEDFSNASFQWVDLDIETGERLAEHRYSKVGLRHLPPPIDPVPLPPSEGEEQPDEGIIGVSPDGRWAVTPEQ